MPEKAVQVSSSIGPDESLRGLNHIRQDLHIAIGQALIQETGTKIISEPSVKKGIHRRLSSGSSHLFHALRLQGFETLLLHPIKNHVAPP